MKNSEKCMNGVFVFGGLGIILTLSGLSQLAFVTIGVQIVLVGFQVYFLKNGK